MVSTFPGEGAIRKSRKALREWGDPEKVTTLHSDFIGRRWTSDVGVAKAMARRVLDECLVFCLNRRALQTVFVVNSDEVEHTLLCSPFTAEWGLDQ